MSARGNPLLAHTWGVSSGADRVWAQIAGMAPSSRPWERLFVVFQAFIDESYDANCFAFAGYIATAEQWAHFSKEWGELLQIYGIRNKSGNLIFKMSQAAKHPEQIRAFYHIIERYALMGISATLDIRDFESAKQSISCPDFPIEWNTSNYYMNFRSLLDIFHAARFGSINPILGNILKNAPVDFYFDKHTAKGDIIEAWDNYERSRPEGVRPFYGAMPKFERDDEFPPLQAADFLAWWVRRAHKKSTMDDIGRCRVPEWRASKTLPHSHIWLTEDDIEKTLINWARERVGPAHTIIRNKYSMSGFGL
jgi:hypothetical protein